jgi:adenylate cyclase, class 2
MEHMSASQEQVDCPLFARAAINGGCQRLLAELKARCSDLVPVRDRLRTRATHEATLHQVDTYFGVPHGRLKLREVTGAPAELIHYERPDLPAVKSSRVHLASLEHSQAVLAVLTAALGVRARVTKTREVWRLEGVQVHLDIVEGLGTFVEFEKAVEDPHVLGQAMDHLQHLIVELGVCGGNLVDRSYGDLT